MHFFATQFISLGGGSVHGSPQRQNLHLRPSARLQTDKLTLGRTNVCGRQGPFFQKALNFENHIFGGGQIGRVGGDICCPRGAMDG